MKACPFRFGQAVEDCVERGCLAYEENDTHGFCNAIRRTNGLPIIVKVK